MSLSKQVVPTHRVEIAPNSESTCKMDHSNYQHNGLITKIWGTAGWTFNHAVTFGYPLNPTSDDKRRYKNYFISLGDVLPCRLCRESYKKFITTGKTALTNEVLRNRHTLTKWFYDVHNAVNNKLEVDYGLSYEDVVNKYESFRAKCGKPVPTVKGCVTPLDHKAFSFKKLYYMDAPIISLDKVEKFVRIARMRGISDKYFCFLELATVLNGDFNELKKQSSWEYRNKYCQKKIRYMRENAIPSIEEQGYWKGTPTIDELKLLLFLCSNLNRTEVNDAIDNVERLESTHYIEN
ncbi:thiol oxidoreductase E10R [Acanthamoeba polyphaga mimivirus]|nr:thiol oxidoreductase E10R [Mimivirus reunion]WMV61963.1 thiol oxidoreductase E10R [Mimivirus sp.]WMV62940.1 thiol oxidoreductase E10R [Acanthamoeba polyphaga mimivirus]WMV63917.1 thiol oxidoreductase E10R [Mimivirus sp.]